MNIIPIDALQCQCYCNTCSNRKVATFPVAIAMLWQYYIVHELQHFICSHSLPITSRWVPTTITSPLC